ncbi:protein KINESIN LIGHT CHAIN-RELATED 2 [Phalaenopsis equestris]|uniref:protein KINESIN LIGHT CHAIN-RELATED 2 n=1 Tax=Phalaenopsis equestris TaxID=78828 RepID=UPI0009E55A14|nr:protein KINESIN LIGHT CHAIN-RELATED 2 [Phalaenopsis equestris]XP_020586121.1 protein KINESIN LIGHT CHAIN-RELATED 2 [Phalaenopsis equestris]XP_020586129.1 protein KINESIN LIGHT CHAIN-RELATED 2 [Phalaenopsis equestris]XP_020586137.1 protein KINESIN LIGHT CHAIN-RELATED 2 [Phalaenopsis equestris]XP_020586144.1 protein KINESIN LIGHT CHAIN-RELATED 2 [Phalaenopsis equestris]
MFTMKRASSSSYFLLSTLLKSTSRSRLLPRCFFLDSSSLNRSLISYPISSAIPIPTTRHQHILLKLHSRCFQTLPDSSPPIPSRQRKLREKSDLEESFESATSTEDILTSFEAFAARLDEKDKKLGLACLKVGQHLDSIGSDDHEKILSFGLRALKVLDDGGEASVSVAMALHLAGSATYELKRFNDSLGFLNRANRILGVLERENSEDIDVRPVIHAVQLQLANTKTAMGRREEALLNLKTCLDLKEVILEPNSRELGVAYRDLAEAYAAVLNFKEALPLCEKALEIHLSQLGQNSVEVAHDRRLLGVIHTGLEDHQKALEQNRLSQKVLKSWGMSSDLILAEIDAANIQIALGKYDEAVKTLKGVAHQADNDSEIRALVFMSMARALCNQEMFAEAKRCLEISCDILEKKETILPSKVAEAYLEISSLYETMNEFTTAISLLKRSLEMIEKLPQEQHMEGNVLGRIGWLLLLTGKVEEGIQYLESAAERMKESFGPKHFAVGYIYNNLGAAFMELERPQTAAQMFALAKDIMDLSLGPHHADSIQTCQSLANAYSAMQSFTLALEFQKKVVDAWASHGASAQDELQEASQVLEDLKKKSFGWIPNLIVEHAKSLAEGSNTAPTKLVPQ